MRHSILQNMIESKNNNYTIYEKENNTWLSDDHGVIAWKCGWQSSCPVCRRQESGWCQRQDRGAAWCDGYAKPMTTNIIAIWRLYGKLLLLMSMSSRTLDWSPSNLPTSRWGFIWVMALIRIKHCMITSSQWLTWFVHRASMESSGYRQGNTGLPECQDAQSLWRVLRLCLHELVQRVVFETKYNRN